MAYVSNMYGMGVPTMDAYQNALLNQRMMAASSSSNVFAPQGFTPDYRYSMADTAAGQGYGYMVPKPEPLHESLAGCYGNLPSMQPIEHQTPLTAMVDSSNYSGITKPSFPIDDILSSHSNKSNKVRAKVQMLHPFYSRRLTGSAAVEGKTRTRDKYRVVYTDKQRIGLEKAYKDDKFITSAKKAELSKSLGLSDRQIKIWFQNRRAKERREVKKSSPVGSPTHSTTEEDENMAAKPSCRFEKENVDTHSSVPDASSFTCINSTDMPMSGYNYYRDHHSYNLSLMSQKTNYTMKEPEVTARCQEVSQLRFQRSPSEWMEAYHYQPVINTVNVSPFASSMDVNYLSRV